MIGIALPRGYARGLLRCVIQNPTHLLWIQARYASGRRRRSKIARDAVGAVVGGHLVIQSAESHGDARAHIVAERNSAHHARSVGAELFTRSERGRYDRTAGMRLRRSM